MDWNKPALIALVETKVEYRHELMHHFNFSNMNEVGASGRTGGLAIFWTEDITVEQIVAMGSTVPCSYQEAS